MKRALVACLALGGAIALAVALVFATAPSPAGLHARFNAQLRATGAEPVDLSSVAPPLRDAVVATEDERFYQHQGVDLIGLLRAIPYDIRHLAFRQGASTITEQLAKVLYFGGYDHAPWRKAQVAALAVRLEARYSKEEILGDYLNAVYFGAGAWGIAKASETYFATSPRRLDLAQASLLAGLIQSPSRYDPFRDPQAARTRQVEVLRAMVQNGFATAGEATRVLERPLPLVGHRALAPRFDLTLALGSALKVERLLLGVLLAGAGFLVLLLRRRRLPRMWRLAAAVSVATGLVMAPASYPFQ